MIARLVLAAAVAALLAGCGGGDDTGPDVSVVVLTDRPAAVQLLAQELPADTMRTQDVPAVAAAGSVSIWAALGARTVVAHYVDVAPTPMDAWRTSDAVCAEAKRLGLGCVITTSATDPIDHATGKRSAAWETGGRLCDLAWLTGQPLAQALARCVRISRGEF